MTATKTKVKLTNTFHGSSVNVIGELKEMGHGIGSEDYDGQPAEGYALVVLSGSQIRRALRSLCGIEECRCSNHGPSIQYRDNPSNPDATGEVIGEVV